MLPLNNSVTEIIPGRFSCRAYTKTPIAAEQASQLAAFAASIVAGPLGTPLRFELALALEHDPKALKGLGTYGLIRDPAGFIIGAAGRGERNLEDFGYGLEAVILYATRLGLGTCWLGGNFTKSSFAHKIRAAGDEIVPAVASIGYPVQGIRTRDRLRRAVKADSRLPWETLFSRSTASQTKAQDLRSGLEASAGLPGQRTQPADPQSGRHTDSSIHRFREPLPAEDAGAYATPLAMLRLAPSSHNYQPWRVVQDGARYHFYLQRTRGYGPGTLPFKLLGMADLQRVDMGIAMCHFELTARELGLEGEWVVGEPDLPKPGGTGEYVVTWLGTAS